MKLDWILTDKMYITTQAKKLHNRPSISSYNINIPKYNKEYSTLIVYKT